MEKSRFQRAWRALIFWTLFIGIGAVGGAAMMLIDPSGRAMGMDAMLPYFQVLPFAEVVFQDLTFSGWALLIVNGLTNLTAAGLLLARKRAGVVLGGAFGVTLMLWICIQFYMPPCFAVFKWFAPLPLPGIRVNKSPRTKQRQSFSCSGVIPPRLLQKYYGRERYTFE